jgi:hypothetical protein
MAFRPGFHALNLVDLTPAEARPAISGLRPPRSTSS